VRKKLHRIALVGIGVLFAVAFAFVLSRRDLLAERDLVRASASGDARAVHRLLIEGVDPNAVVRPDPASDFNWWGHEILDPGDRRIMRRPAILAAAESGSKEIVGDLLAHGANPNFADGTGYSALLSASHKGDEEMVRMLLNYGANPRLGWKDGTTPLDAAPTDRIRRLMADRS
jgi:ankyrin repeat protein